MITGENKKGVSGTMFTRKSLLRLAVCLAFAITLFAFTAAPSLAYYGNEQNPANAAITKVLALGQETPTPNITFTFQIEKVSLDGDTSSAALAIMPTIGNASGNPNIGTITISFSSNDTYPSLMHSKRESQTDYLPKESQQTLFPYNTLWPRAGVYLYKVTEAQTTNYYLADPNRETLTLSKAQYYINAVVTDRTPPVYGYYVWGIAAYHALDDEGASVQQGNKIDCTPGGNQQFPYNTRYSQMIFNNKYLRHGSTQPPVNPGTDIKLKISKSISGLASSISQYFNFDVTIKKPIISTKTSYRVYVFEGTSSTPLSYSQIMQNVNNQTILNYAGYIDMPIGVPVRFMLKHNQYLAFTNIDAGATYTVNELATTNYTPSYTLTKGGVFAGNQTGTTGSSLNTPSAPPVTVTISPTNSWNDTVAFNNKFIEIDLGIAVDDMPYLVIIAAVLAILGGYLFFKARGQRISDFRFFSHRG